MTLEEALAECRIIRTSLERVNCYDNVIMDYKIIRKSSAEELDTEYDTGKWNIKYQTSPINDSTDIYMELRSENLMRKKDGDTTRPMLVVQCSTTYHTPENVFVFIEWNVDLGRHPKMRLIHRFNRRDAVKRPWTLSNDRLASYHEDPISFIPKLLKNQELQVQIEPPLESFFIARFNLDGFENTVKAIKDECGW
jgi:hypothetical protein